ncbi:MAG: hypothetical protein O3A46_01840 [Candidatus Poribacteria bacterium]|nr:hypothetical protein [Candidatus Poribacteria bacterium]
MASPNPADLIPSAGNIPLPGPEWLFHALLVFTFILHIIPMNFVLGGGVTTLYAEIMGSRRNDDRFRRLARGLAQITPYATAAAITTGIAPLLFVQVLYGQYFYTSSVLIGSFWISVIALLIVGYYGLYRNSFRVKHGKSLSMWTAWGSSIIFIVIGFIYSNNMTLMLTPEKWRDLYAAGGHTLNLSEPSLYPRYLHFLVGSIAVSGALVVAYGLFAWKKDDGYGRWLVRAGAFQFIAVTGAQFIVGFTFLFALREEWRMIFLGGSVYATGLLLAGLTFAVVSMALFLIAALRDRPATPAIAGMIALALTITFMAMMRDALRRHALEPFVTSFNVVPQTVVMTAFFVLFVAALAIIGWMVAIVLRAGKSTGKASD